MKIISVSLKAQNGVEQPFNVPKGAVPWGLRWSKKEGYQLDLLVDENAVGIKACTGALGKSGTKFTAHPGSRVGTCLGANGATVYFASTCWGTAN